MELNYIFEDALDSTNLYLENLIDNGVVKEGTVVYCNRQLAGKGQGSNKWESNPLENITFSLFINPEFLNANEQFFLNKVICVSICQYIESVISNTKVCIKWPNDIYIDNKKIAGVLIEHAVIDSMLYSSIIGIGLNVNQVEFKSAPNPISLKMITQTQYEIVAEMKSLISEIVENYKKLKLDKRCFDNEYMSRLYLRNQCSKFEYMGNPLFACVVDVNSIGQIVLIDDANNTIICNQGELSYFTNFI